ncbi:MAG: hypothetical protein SynsKO_14090 [Synoicihabitans sp.]
MNLRSLLHPAIAALAAPGAFAAADIDAPRLWQEVKVPSALLQTTEVEGQHLTFGGDIRIGDLNGDGQLEFIVFRSTDEAMKPCFMGAFDLAGNVLWQIGEGGDQPARPGPVTIYDFDGDGRDEILHFWHDPMVENAVENMADVRLQLRDGRTGELLRESTPALFADAAGEGANWVHQRPFIANFRGGDRAQDFVVKLGERVIAFDDTLSPLWHYIIPWNEYTRCSAYIPAVGDIDGDGRDEVTGGYYLLDDDGTVMWAKQLDRNMDSVSIEPWDGNTPRVIASGGGHVIDAGGKPLIHLGEELVPHGQEVRVGDFVPTRPGREMIIRWNGHKANAMTVSQTGEVLHRFMLNDSPNHTGMETVYWHGHARPPLLYNGGVLWHGNGKRAADLPKLPAPIGPVKMGWYHAIPVNVLGDSAEELVIYNPWESVVRIYRAASTDPEDLRDYQPTPRQYNARLMD